MPEGMKWAGPVNQAISDFHRAREFEIDKLVAIGKEIDGSLLPVDWIAANKETHALQITVNLLDAAMTLAIYALYPSLNGKEVGVCLGQDNGVCLEGVWYHEEEGCDCRRCKNAEEFWKLLSNAQVVFLPQSRSKYKRDYPRCSSAVTEG